VIVLQSVVLLALALVVQAGIGRLWPGAHRYIDLFLVPVVFYGTAVKPRASMLSGCAGGLLKDTWFHVGTFGLGGFKLTLLGWLLAIVAGRLDLTRNAGRFLSGVAIAVSDEVLDLFLRWLLDQQPQMLPLPTLVAKALITGLLASVVGSMLDRVAEMRRVKRFV
jgi:cell shape-determining protein MreD